MPKRTNVDGKLTDIVSNDLVWFNIPKEKREIEVLLNPIVADYIESLELLIKANRKPYE